MSARVLLVRHPEVARVWAGRCYGQSDMGWSRAGADAATALVDRLAATRPTAIVHSDLSRTRRLAIGVGRRVGLQPVADRLWRERHFGAWEGRSWDAIFRGTGDEMDRMTSDPIGYRPGGGETTAEMAARTISAWHALPIDGTVIVVAHGGPIAAIRAALAGAPYSQMATFVPRCGEVIESDGAALPAAASPKSVVTAASSRY